MRITYSKMAHVAGTPASALDLLERDFSPLGTGDGWVTVDAGDFKSTLQSRTEENSDTEFLAEALAQIENESIELIGIITFVH